VSVKIIREKQNIPTYEPHAPNDLPMFFEKRAYQGAEGRVYPIPFTDRLSNEPVEHEYDTVTISNEHIEVVLLPEIGGKIHKATDLHNNYEFIYGNTVIKPAMVGLAGPWVSGGVEFNWPQHHRPTTFMPLEATIRENPDGSKTCIMGEAEPFHRMRGQVAITVYPGSSVVEAVSTVYNTTDKPLPFMWWNNLAVRVHDKYKACFPPDVEWGNDHDRRAVISFPVMKGVYKTARPFNYGDGTDVTWYNAIKLPTSVMVSKGQSDMDFLGGYDFAADAGTVTVSDHHISPGKKMWTWGDGVFGHTWCANLTDNGDRYIELMTGTYTDNQPDFTYIMPGECRKFTNIWFPIKGIGEPKNASRDGALSLEVADGIAKIGAVTTRLMENASLVLTCGGKEIARVSEALSPENFILTEVPVCGSDLKLTLYEGDDEILSYTPYVKGTREPLKAREIPPRPKDINSIEELYLHGKHLSQYKHHTYEAEDYFAEALRRDDKDYRCNLEMGRLMIEKGEFDEVEKYLTKAADRIRMRNDNPSDTESLYLLAMVNEYKKDYKKAYKLYNDAAWQYAWRSPSMFKMACISIRLGQISRAVDELDECIVTNGRHYAARTLKAYITRDTAALERILDEVPQDTFARFALNFISGRAVEGYILGRAEDCLDAALNFKSCGMSDEAVKCIDMCENKNALLGFHKYALTGVKEKGEMHLCFPNRLEDMEVLDIDDADAQYLLGCVYYDRKNYCRAADAWEKSLRMNECNAFAHRNLALAYFDHLGQRASAQLHLERAMELAPENARILYELLQLYKNILKSPQERIALLESHGDLARERDDCFLELAILYTQAGELDKARELLLSKRFNIYEGGEGKLTKHHGWLYTLLGREAENNNDTDAAKNYYKNAFIFPKNYGEGRHYSAQEGNINYYFGLLLDKLGEHENAVKSYEAAANQPTHITEISYFAAKAMEKLGRADEAKALYNEMLQTANNRLANADLYGYFGVGMPAPLPFEQDIERINTNSALLLKALACDGLGDAAGRDDAVTKLKKTDPHGTPYAFFAMLGILG